MITLTEISANLAKRYTTKANKAAKQESKASHKAFKAGDGDGQFAHTHKFLNRVTGLAQASNIIRKDKDKKAVIKPAEETTESTRRTVKSTVSGKEANAMIANATRLSNNRTDGGRIFNSKEHGTFSIRLHPTDNSKFEVTKLVKEDLDETQLDELSNDTLKSYRAKAKPDEVKQAAIQDKNRHYAAVLHHMKNKISDETKGRDTAEFHALDRGEAKAGEAGERANIKRWNRATGIRRAGNRLHESLSSLFMDGDMVENAGGAEGVVRAHNNATFIVEWADGAKTVHDQVSGRRWTMEGLTDDDAVQLIAETSTDKLYRYVDAASTDRTRLVNKREDGRNRIRALGGPDSVHGKVAAPYVNFLSSKIKKRSKYIDQAARRRDEREAGVNNYYPSHTVRESELDELSKETLKSYHTKAEHAGASARKVADEHDRAADTNEKNGTKSAARFMRARAERYHATADKREAGAEVAKRKLGESNLDELSKETLKSYHTKANYERIDAIKRADNMYDVAGKYEHNMRHMGLNPRRAYRDAADAANRKAIKRGKGMFNAVLHSMNKEEVEEQSINELSKQTLSSYQDKAHVDLDDAIRGANSMHDAADRSARNGRVLQKRFGVRPGEVFGIGTSGYRDAAKSLEKIASRRVRGIHRADVRLNKEEVEEAEKAKLDDLLKNDHKAYKLQDTVDKDGKKHSKIVSRPTKEDVEESEDLFEDSDTHNDEDKKFQDAVDKHPILGKTFGSSSPHKVRSANDALRDSEGGSIVSHQHSRKFTVSNPMNRDTNYTMSHSYHPKGNGSGAKHNVSIIASNSDLKDRVIGQGAGNSAEEALDSAHKAFAADHKAHKFHMYKKIAGALT